MSQATNPKVHLVGSMPVANADEAFMLCGRTLAGQLDRVPDGGVHGWINFSIESLSQARGLERIDPRAEVHVRAWATQEESREYHERSRGEFGPKLRLTPTLHREVARANAGAA